MSRFHSFVLDCVARVARRLDLPGTVHVPSRPAPVNRRSFYIKGRG